MTDVSSSVGWKLRLCIVAVVFGGIARNGNVLADGQIVRTARPHDLPPLPVATMATADQLPKINRVLAMPGDHHDAILDILRIGDATSVPFLIVALERQGAVPREGAYSAIDTRVHCLEALQRITNQDAGRNADDWRSWYEANKGKTQEEWIRDGFAAHGFPVSSPPDEAFVTALVRAAAPGYRPDYLRTNALRMLKGVPADMLVRIARPLAASPEVSDRRAAVAALDEVVSDTAIETLRGLKSDRDIEVAENALRTLNAALRKTLPSIDAPPAWNARPARTRVNVLHVLDEHTVVLGIRHSRVDQSRVVGFDLVTRRILWTYLTHGNADSNAVRIGDRLYFVSDDRVIHCITIDGRPRWTRQLTADPNCATTGPAITVANDRLFVPDNQTVFVATPTGRVQTYAMDDYVSRSLVRGPHHVVGAIRNGPLLVFDDFVGPPRRVDTGLRIAALSAAGDVICGVSFGPAYQLQCLDEATLQELWRADLPKEAGAYDALEQDAENVYVLAQGRALAFSVRNGKRLWATNEFRSFAFFRVFGRLALTQSARFELEWRDPQSGEVIAQMGGPGSGSPLDARRVGDHALLEIMNDPDGELRLLTIPGALTAKLRAH